MDHIISNHTPILRGVPADDVTVVVIVRPDYDCDGYSEGYHRVPVRTRDWLDRERVGETAIIARAMCEDAAGFTDDPSGCMLMSEGEFLGRCWDRMTTWARDYWFENGYTSTTRMGA